MKTPLVYAALVAAVICGTAQAGPAEDLTIAAEMDDGRAVTALLLKGVDPNLTDDRGRTALQVALRETSLRALQSLLLAPQLAFDAPNKSDETPLMTAAIRGSLPAVQALVKRGAAVNRPGWSPLHYACSGPDNGVAVYLLAQGAAIDAPSANGTTPLMMAARYGSADLVPVLLKAGANPTLTNEQGLSAADFARRAGRDVLAVSLVQAASRAGSAPK
jgi:hypothetical protein